VLSRQRRCRREGGTGHCEQVAPSGVEGHVSAGCDVRDQCTHLSLSEHSLRNTTALRAAEIPVVVALTTSRRFSTARKTACACCCSAAPWPPATSQLSFERLRSTSAPARTLARTTSRRRNRDRSSAPTDAAGSEDDGFVSGANAEDGPSPTAALLPGCTPQRVPGAACDSRDEAFSRLDQMCGVEYRWLGAVLALPVPREPAVRRLSR